MRETLQRLDRIFQHILCATLLKWVVAGLLQCSRYHHSPQSCCQFGEILLGHSLKACQKVEEGVLPFCHLDLVNGLIEGLLYLRGGDKLLALYQGECRHPSRQCHPMLRSPLSHAVHLIQISPPEASVASAQPEPDPIQEWMEKVSLETDATMEKELSRGGSSNLFCVQQDLPTPCWGKSCRGSHILHEINTGSYALAMARLTPPQSIYSEETGHCMYCTLGRH